MLTALSIFFSIFIPREILDKKIKKWLIHAGSKDDERVWAGTRLFLSLLMAAIGFLIPFSIIPLYNVLSGSEIYFEPQISAILMFVFGIISFFVALGIFYLHISYVIDGRKRMVEAILPDFLFLVGNNLRSGMTPFYAFRSAIRPEFGPLSEEISIATKKSLGIQSFSDALKGLAKRIDSKILTDTTRFFAQALRSGGRLAQLIETSANDIKQTNVLKKELASSTRMYVLFIIFVVVIASPMLLAVSVQFLQILSSIQMETGNISGVGDAEISNQVGLTGAAISITPEFMKLMGQIIIVINGLLASVFMGVIGGGKIRDGLKFAPVICIVGVVIFEVLLGGIGLLIGGFM
jgi:archaeal flagellar protein FlaJ